MLVSVNFQCRLQPRRALRSSSPQTPSHLPFRSRCSAMGSRAGNPNIGSGSRGLSSTPHFQPGCLSRFWLQIQACRAGLSFSGLCPRPACCRHHFGPPPGAKPPPPRPRVSALLLRAKSPLITHCLVFFAVQPSLRVNPQTGQFGRKGGEAGFPRRCPKEKPTSPLLPGPLQRWGAHSDGFGCSVLFLCFSVCFTFWGLR